MKILFGTTNFEKVKVVKRGLARFSYRWIEVDNGLDAFEKVIAESFDLLILDFNLPRMNSIELMKRIRAMDKVKAPPVLVITHSDVERREVEAERFPQTDLIPWPISMRQLVMKVNQTLNQQIRVTCLGGGTGLFTLLSGLKTLPGIKLTSIVSMSDDGGSTGKLRDIFGMLPPGDIRRSLVALSNAPDLLNELIQYRFERGEEFQGHNIGNLLLTALCEMRGSMTNAVKSLGEILNIQGAVIPVTEMPNTLKAELEDGSLVEGEHRIDLFDSVKPASRIKRLWQEPMVMANPDALQAIINSEFIILGPGDLFTSIISNLIVEGISEAIRSSYAKKIYVCNIMTKPGETSDFKVSDHAFEIIKYLKEDVLDYMICSASNLSEESLEVYAKKNQVPVVQVSEDRVKSVTKAQALWQDVAHTEEIVRHDSLKLALALKNIIFPEK